MLIIELNYKTLVAHVCFYINGNFFFYVAKGQVCYERQCTLVWRHDVNNEDIRKREDSPMQQFNTTRVFSLRTTQLSVSFMQVWFLPLVLLGCWCRPRSFVPKGYLCLQCQVILFVLNSLFNVLTWFAKNLLDDFRAVRPILALKWLRLSTRSAHGSPHAHSPRPTIINLASCDCVNNVRRHPISCGVLRLFKFSCRTNRVKLPNSIKRRKNVKGVLVCLFGSFSSIHRPSG